MIISYYDDMEIYECITEVPKKALITHEFGDVKQMTNYISILKSINNEYLGNFLYMSFIQPITQSSKFTNQYNFNLN